MDSRAAESRWQIPFVKFSRGKDKAEICEDYFWLADDTGIGGLTGRGTESTQVGTQSIP
jgi:hypothetical protein